ncbi:hypothetical protein GCT13_17130 [Paraburkholderia sp. CNPSo 3157]|uniref:Uncharacterized protein n=1 Tax=Paraburkholderia franconis TaxID=2654983 RepID=A0A7X1NAX4_9BURK|nr:hypothetical protein [Paraburkholderia franconis]MPW18592.1 hypothetical protein [Paraburkholderia franconis]
MPGTIVEPGRSDRQRAPLTRSNGREALRIKAPRGPAKKAGRAKRTGLRTGHPVRETAAEIAVAMVVMVAKRRERAV